MRWQGLIQVSFGELDAMIMEISNALFEIEKRRITNLRLAGDAGYELQLAIGIRKDWPILKTIVDKALSSITTAEREKIFNRWIKLEPYRFYQSRLFWYVVIVISASVILIIGTILIWNRTLKSQVRQRTEEIHFNERRLEALLELSQRTDTSIQEIIEFAFRKMVQLTQSHFGYLAFQDREGLIYVTSPTIISSPLTDDLQTSPEGLDPELKGFWGAVAETGKELISNNYNQSNPKERGVPERFQPIIRYMNIPVFSGDQMVAVVDMGNEDFRATYLYTIKELSNLDLGYVHIMDGLAFGFHEKGEPMTLAEFRAHYDGVIIGNCGYSKEDGEQRVAAGLADIVAFGRPYISNPDLVEHLQNG